MSDNRRLAPFARRRLTVLAVDELGAYRLLRLADPDASVSDSADGQAAGRIDGRAGRRAPRPGQFAMLAAAERWGAGDDERPYLPRAFSYARFVDREAHFLLEDVGPGTRRLCELRPGEGVWTLGPLGVGFAAPADRSEPGQDVRRAVLAGGGAGIAPLAIWQDALEDATVLLGFRDRHHAAGAALLRDAQVATDDGSVGHRGAVTDLLGAELDRDPHAVVYACGPAPMLEAVRAMCAARAVPAQLALESGMACGFGACFGCVVPRRGGGYLRVCVDGPVIDAAELEQVEPHAGAPA